MVKSYSIFPHSFHHLFVPKGGLLGHTFSHMLGDQFKALKDGDRFFFTHSNGDNMMGLHKQIQDMIMNRTLRDVMCQNTGNIPELPANVFRKDDTLVSCEEIADLDFDSIAKIISGHNNDVEATSSSSYETSPSYEEPSKDIYI